MKFIETELGINVVRKIVWSDLKCVLHWIASKKLMSVFVHNCLTEIRSQKFEFHYVSTKESYASILPISSYDKTNCIFSCTFRRL